LAASRVTWRVTTPSSARLRDASSGIIKRRRRIKLRDKPLRRPPLGRPIRRLQNPRRTSDSPCADPVALNDFVSPFRVVQLSRMIARRAALLQTSLTRRLGENDAWIAATAIAYGATLIGRERAFFRVPRWITSRFDAARRYN
jgi:hypothetical protein